jgi:ABC-type amino acid transport substrate-binding protein
MFRLATTLIIGSLFASTAIAAKPEGRLGEIAKTQTIIIGHRNEAVPFSFLDTDGQPKGYMIDLCTRISASVQRQLGLEKLDIKWVPVTAENRFDLVANGKIDFECGVSTNTISRQKVVDFSLMTWVDGANFLVKGEERPSDLSVMNGKKIAVIQGTTTEQALKTAMEKLQITLTLVPVQEHLDGMKLMAEGKVDAYAADQTVLIGMAASVGPNMKVSMAEQNYSFEPYGLVVQRNDADLKQAVNASIAQLYRSGEILRIYNNWFGQLGKPPQALLIMYGMNALPE